MVRTTRKHFKIVKKHELRKGKVAKLAKLAREAKASAKIKVKSSPVSSSSKKFYITTPIYYPNDIPHIGHAYTTIAGDILARWHKLLGEEVFYLTGTDEHGKKIQEVALKAGKTPKQFVDDLIPEFKQAWAKLDVEYDRFIRTTDSDHEKVVGEIVEKIYKSGDIYLGEYEGLYCVGCEAYYTEKDLIEENLCPIHKKPVEKLKEKSYFFKLSKYQKPLLELYKKNPEFLLPKSRANEVINRVKEGLQDLSISRTSFNWGIQVPFDKKHILYVWMDALFNYYSATRSDGKEKFWPVDVNLIGKDILWFHAVYWPAFLMAAKLQVPKTIFAHGWWTFDKEKISKSRGKIINIDQLVNIAGVDSARYFLFRETSFGSDGDFSEKALVERHNSELADKFGNLISRVTALAEKYGLEKIPNNLLKKLDVKKIALHMKNYEMDKALAEIFAFIDICNEYVQSKKPWETHDKKVLYELIDSIKSVSILLTPFMPKTCEKIAKHFGFEIKYENINKNLDYKDIKKAEILFKKIEFAEVKPVVNVSNAKINKPSAPAKIEGITTMSEIINYEQFSKTDLRVGTIKKVEDVEGADKLLKIEVDLGEVIGKRTILAGLKKYYSKEELTEKQVIVVVNLEPRKMKGMISEGMLLAAGSGDDSQVILLAPEKSAGNGWKVM